MTTQPEFGSNIAPDFVTPGRDFLAEQPDFVLIGREEELADISDVLLRLNSSNVILTGPPGAGVSSLLAGLQASKDKLDTPFDIVSKRFFWLDTDGLFASGDIKQINEGFQKALKRVTRSPNSVLIIEDMVDFIDAARVNGCQNVVNALMRECRKNRRFQLILETRDTDLPELLKVHSDLTSFFIIKEIGPPEPDKLDPILEAICKELERHHKIPVSTEARAAAIALTNRYYVKALDRAQPKRAKLLIEGALTAYRRWVHARPTGLDDLERRLESINLALGGAEAVDDLRGRSEADLQGLAASSRAEIGQLEERWEAHQRELRRVYQDQTAAEEQVMSLDRSIEAEREKQAREAQQRGEAAQQNATPEQGGSSARRFRARFGSSGLDNETISSLKQERVRWHTALEENRTKYLAMTEDINRGLVLPPEFIFQQFSKLSGLDVGRLREDEATKLLDLEKTLASRVYGQPEPVSALSKSVRRGRTGLKKANKPIGSFIFLGPTGVGKTEMAKALSAALFGDESMLRSYDMSEYQEKHAVSALIGAPPGYEGYEYGGLLTNAMRKHPRCVNVFDEIEKAHKDVFDLFLQIVDEGRLTDRRGLVASFADSVNILTSNIGQPYFLDESLTFEEAKKKALADLWDPVKGGYRPEFLARFTGIFCFNRLGLPTVELIAARGLQELNTWIDTPGLSVEMSEAELKAMCADQYDARRGARSILIGWVENHIASEAAETMLRNPDQTGVIRVAYDRDAGAITTDFEAGGPAPDAAQDGL